MEQLPSQENHQEEQGVFIFPNLLAEVGEIERTGKHFGIEGEDFVRKFVQKASSTSLAALSEDVWEKLENTDSVDIGEGDWGAVKNFSGQVSRDWESLKIRIDNGKSIDAPIIAKHEDIYHLVSGNTRLMVAKATGAIPQVLIVNIDDLK